MTNIYELLTRLRSFARDGAWPRPWTLWPRDRWRGSALKPGDQTPLGWRSRTAWPGCTRCSSGCPWRWCPSCLLSHNPEIIYLNYPDFYHVHCPTLVLLRVRRLSTSTSLMVKTEPALDTCSSFTPVWHRIVRRGLLYRLNKTNLSVGTIRNYEFITRG